MAGTIISGIGLIFISIAAFFAYKQLRGMALNSMLEVWGVESKNRGFVIEEFESKKVDKLDEWNKLNKEDREKADSVLLRCNRIALMANKNVISKEDVLELFGPQMLNCYKACEWYIKLRRERDRNKNYGRPFEQFIQDKRNVEIIHRLENTGHL